MRVTARDVARCTTAVVLLGGTTAVSAQTPAPAPAPVQASVPSLPEAVRAPAPVRVLALTAPERVGRYARGERRDFGSPQAGVGYQYDDGSGTRLTVYFYERQDDARAATPESAVAREVEVFKEALEVEQARGMYEAYRIAFEQPDSVVVSGKRVSGSQLVFAFRRGQQVFVSLYYVFAVGDGFIKMRGTVPEAGWQQTDVPVFAHALVAQALGGAREGAAASTGLGQSGQSGQSGQAAARPEGTWRPPAGQACQLLAVPPGHERAADLVDSATAAAVLPSDSAFGHGTALFAVGIAADGMLVEFRLLESDIPVGARRRLTTAVGSLVKAQAPGAPWRTRLAVTLGAAPRFVLEPSEFCPAAVRERGTTTTEERYEPGDRTVNVAARWWVRLDRDGRVVDLRLLTPTGYRGLEAAAAASLRQLRFYPALVDRVAVPVEDTVTYYVSGSAH